MSCEFTHYDGAYVLGALSASERTEYQRHLATCHECTTAVQELAGLPGLLARVGADVLETPRVDEEVPPTLLPALVREVRRGEQRRTRVAVGIAAAAAAVITGGALVVGGAFEGDGAPTVTPPLSTTSPSGPAGQAMVPTGSEPMAANLALTSVAWGTRLDLVCTYRSVGDTWADTDSTTYAMFVRGRDGQEEQVASWNALPGKSMHLTAATATGRDDIASVVIRTAAGRAVLTLVA